MSRCVLALVFVLWSVPVWAQTPLWEVTLPTLGLGRIYAVVPVELDNKPGAEYLVKTDLFAATWMIVLPNSPRGFCLAGTVSAIFDAMQIRDLDADGRDDYLVFNYWAQTVRAYRFDVSRCE